MTENINPNQLFGTLSLKPDGQIKSLWDIQVEVLDRYYSILKDSKRVAIELPTGSGKSIISLLILEMWRKSGKRVAILTSSIALSDDMKRRCDDLGIPNVVITGRARAEAEDKSMERIRNIRDYKRKNAIGVMNYWAYMMAKDIALPDVLVIDDADSFEGLLINQYSVSIRKEEDSDIYNYLLKELTRYRIYQRLETFSSAPSSEDIQLVYFPHAMEMASKVGKIISSRGRSGISDELFWSFERNKDALHTYLMFVSALEITFVPYIVTGSMHERIRNVFHVIYTSATLGTAERIHKTMGSIDNIVILAEKDITSRVGTMGTRIIFALNDISTTGKVDAKVLDSINRITNTFKKVLVICNSYFDATKVIEHLQREGHRVILYQGEADSTRFAGEPEGALVTAGRRIGLDLPGEACQVGIVTRMPYILGPVDLLVKNILEDHQYSDEKVSHRLVQSFGRCNRNPGDCAIYYMLDNRLAYDIIGDEEVYQHFPRRMKAELDIGQEYAEVGGLTKTIEVGQLVLNGKLPNVEEEILNRLDKISIKRSSALEKPYMDEIRGWCNLTERRNYMDAIQSFSSCIKYYETLGISNATKNRQMAWLHYVVANCCYLASVFFNDDKYKGDAIEHLTLAMKSGYTSWFSGLQIVINRLKEAKEEEEAVFNVEIQGFRESLLRKWKEFYASNSIGRRNPLEAWGRMREALAKGRHDSVCHAYEQVLELMGFEVSVIRRTPAKPDLIMYSNVGKRYVVIVEVKSKESGDVLKTEAIDQIGGHKTQYQDRYPDRPVYPLVFTNKGEISKDAIPKAKGNVRILRNSEFIVLMNKYIELMEKGWKIEDPLERLAFMDRVPTLDAFEVIFKPSKEPLVSLEDVQSIL